MKAGQDLKNQAAHPHQEFPGAPSRKSLLSARLHSSENAEGKVVFGLFSDEENQKVRESEGLGLQHFYSWRFRFWQQYCWTYTENVPNDATLRFFFFIQYLCISQFQLHPAPPRATAGHLPALSVPGVGHLQILCCPGAGHLPTPGPFLSFWHAGGFLSENNYTEDFTGKESRLAHLSRTGKIEEVFKGMFLILCMHFFIAYRARIK